MQINSLFVQIGNSSPSLAHRFATGADFFPEETEHEAG
jgi:hypothetical protein